MAAFSSCNRVNVGDFLSNKLLCCHFQSSLSLSRRHLQIRETTSPTRRAQNQSLFQRPSNRNPQDQLPKPSREHRHAIVRISIRIRPLQHVEAHEEGPSEHCFQRPSSTQAASDAASTKTSESGARRGSGPDKARPLRPPRQRREQRLKARTEKRRRRRREAETGNAAKART